MPSKSLIDKAGRSLLQQSEPSLESIELEYVFDDYRASHLEPLSRTTLEIQEWLHSYGSSYYIAQRLKRKPQIIRKLRRLSVRLTQLQDVGGCRIILSDNAEVDSVVRYLEQRISLQEDFRITRRTDYRRKGRDESGYRSVHLILERDSKTFELQIRSRIQHYWAESIERTSVIYGRHLKELDGDPVVIGYFKSLSDVFYEIESGRDPSSQAKIALDQLRENAQAKIYESDRNRIFDSSINEDVVKTLTAAQGSPQAINNWIIVFDWKSGEFTTWESVGMDPSEAVKKYAHYESQFPADQSFEVVLIGSSDIATVRKTHSHYFGIEKFDTILENLDESIIGFQTRMDIDVGSRKILALLVRKKYWGGKSVLTSTLKNHFARGIITFDYSIDNLRERGLIIPVGGAVSLNLKRKAEIESYL